MKILIVDEMHVSISEMLQAKGFVADYAPNISKNDILNVISGYQGLIMRSKITVDETLLNLATNLKFIARAGAGLDQIDLEAVKKRNITLLHAPEGNRDAVGEHTLAMLLCLMNKLHLSDYQVKKGIWQREQNRGFEIVGKTVGIIGYGNMGNAFAQRLFGFRCKVLAYDKHKVAYGNAFATEASLTQIFEESDIISLHIPLNDETKGWADDSFFQSFKKNIWFINTSRGEIVPLQAIANALKNGKIIGAALDVLENEKLNTFTKSQEENFKILSNADNVLLSPHVAGWTEESYRRINEVLVAKIERMNEMTAKV